LLLPLHNNLFTPNAGGYYEPSFTRRRSQKDIDDDRVRLGITKQEARKIEVHITRNIKKGFSGILSNRHEVMAQSAKTIASNAATNARDRLSYEIYILSILTNLRVLSDEAEEAELIELLMLFN
jgi:hypothetical protein